MKITTPDMLISNHDRKGLLEAMEELMNQKSNEFKRRKATSLSSRTNLSISQNRELVSERSHSRLNNTTSKASSLRNISRSSLASCIPQAVPVYTSESYTKSRNIIFSKINKSLKVTSRPKIIRKKVKCKSNDLKTLPRVQKSISKFIIKSKSLKCKNQRDRSTKYKCIKSNLNMNRTRTIKSRSRSNKKKLKVMKSRTIRNCNQRIQSRVKYLITKITSKPKSSKSRSNAFVKKSRIIQPKTTNNNSKNNGTCISKSIINPYEIIKAKSLRTCKSKSNKSRLFINKKKDICRKSKNVKSKSIKKRSRKSLIYETDLRKCGRNHKLVKTKPKFTNTKNKSLKRRAGRSAFAVGMKIMKKTKSSGIYSRIFKSRKSIKKSTNKTSKRPLKK